METKEIRQKPVIISIDDDPTVLHVLNYQLRKRFSDQFHCEFGESAEEGLEIIEECAREGRTVVMIVSDQIMPGMTGDQFLVNVHKGHPKPIKVLLTGQAAVESAMNAINNANLFRYLTKPWDEEDFLLTVEKGLQQYYLFDQLDAKNLELQETVGVFRRFVPDAIQERIAKEGIHKIDLGSASEGEATVMFSDLRSFCELAENLAPAETLSFLNQLMEPMIPIIHDHDGFIHQFVGDGLMSIFYTQGETSSVDRAIGAAIAMQQGVNQVNQENLGKTRPQVRMGIGLNSGKITTGTIGNLSRMDAAVTGDPVNLASRMENLTKRYGAQILVTGKTLDDWTHKKDVLHRSIDRVRVSGKKEVVEIHEIFEADDPESRAGKAATLASLQEALEQFWDGNWETSQALFEKCQTDFPGDPVPSLFIGRCQDLIQEPPQGTWDGVYSMEKT